MCVVGCGEQAANVLREIRGMPDGAELFFASELPQDAKSYCETYGGAGFFQTYEEAATDPRVQAMYFATPHHVHLENALIAASHSKHILMEKPIALTINETRKMITATDEGGVILMVSEPFRYLDTVATCKQLLADGAIGDVRAVTVHSEHYSPEDNAGWRLSAELRGGGELIDGGIHYVDILVNIGGLPESVYALELPKATPELESEDGVALTARFPGGAAGVLIVSAATQAAEDLKRVTVTGSKGRITFDPTGRSVTVDANGEVRTVRVGAESSSTRRMMREFWDCVQTGRKPVMSGEEGLKDLAVVVAAYESLKTGDRVDVAGP